MDGNGTFDRVVQRIHSLPRHGDDNVRTDSRLKEDLALQSIDLVELVLSLEDEFNITIDDERVKDINTIGEVIDYIYEKLGAEARCLG